MGFIIHGSKIFFSITKNFELDPCFRRAFSETSCGTHFHMVQNIAGIKPVSNVLFSLSLMSVINRTNFGEKKERSNFKECTTTTRSH